MAKKKTPEELKQEKEQRKTEGVEALGQIEREVAKRKTGDVTTKGARRQLIADVKKTGSITGAAGMTTVADVQAKKQEIGQQLQQTGAFDVPTPQEVNLTPTEQAPLPIGGATGSAMLSSLAYNRGLRKLLGERKFYGTKATHFAAAGGITGEEAFPVNELLSPREMALNKISQKAYDKGISAGETFGAMVEAIPVAGSLIGRYVGGLVEAPYSNAKTVKQNIVGYREEATNLIEKTNRHFIPPQQALERANQMEEDIARLKGRLKLLTQTSAILRANQDELNDIQREIYRTEQIVQTLKQAAGFAYTAELSGTYKTPTEEELYFQLYNEQ